MRRKTRLTITLSPDLVAKLDGMIDKRTIRSRSHAVEILLRQSLSPKVPIAVLLAGGRREFMGNAPVNGRPLIARTMEHLMDFGVRSFIVLAGRHEAAIREVVGNGEGLGARITYIREERPLGTAGALKLAEPHLGADPFLVIHADVLTDIDLQSFMDFHFREKTLATMAVKPRQAEESYGKAMLQGNRITEFIDSLCGHCAVMHEGMGKLKQLLPLRAFSVERIALRIRLRALPVITKSSQSLRGY